MGCSATSLRKPKPPPLFDYFPFWSFARFLSDCPRLKYVVWLFSVLIIFLLGFKGFGEGISSTGRLLSSMILAVSRTWLERGFFEGWVADRGGCEGCG